MLLLGSSIQPLKVHWAEKEKTRICNIMKKELFVSILEGTHLPLITDENGVMHYNDSKHTYGYAVVWLKDSSNWWKIPAKLPDLNPIAQRVLT